MVVFILKQTAEREGRDWILLFTKQGNSTPVFVLNLSLTLCCPFCLPVVLKAIPLFLFFFLQSKLVSFPSLKT